jgi:putative flippase GtrA
MSAPRQFAKFIAVGALNTLFGYSVFVVLVLAGLAATPALVLTYVVGVTFNFFTTRRYVFAGRGGAAAATRFVVAYVVIYLFNAGLFALAARAAAGPLLAQALCLPVVAVFSFLLFKFQVFRDG